MKRSLYLSLLAKFPTLALGDITVYLRLVTGRRRETQAYEAEVTINTGTQITAPQSDLNQNIQDVQETVQACECPHSVGRPFAVVYFA